MPVRLAAATDSNCAKTVGKETGSILRPIDEGAVSGSLTIPDSEIKMVEAAGVRSDSHFSTSTCPILRDTRSERVPPTPLYVLWCGSVVAARGRSAARDRELGGGRGRPLPGKLSLRRRATAPKRPLPGKLSLGALPLVVAPSEVRAYRHSLRTSIKSDRGQHHVFVRCPMIVGLNVRLPDERNCSCLKCLLARLARILSSPDGHAASTSGITGCLLHAHAQVFGAPLPLAPRPRDQQRIPLLPDRGCAEISDRPRDHVHDVEPRSFRTLSRIHRAPASDDRSQSELLARQVGALLGVGSDERRAVARSGRHHS